MSQKWNIRKIKYLSLTLSDINWDSSELCGIQIKELLANYLNDISIQNLIVLQKQEKWILNAEKRHNFFHTEGLLFRATQLSNGVKVCQLVLPDKLSYDLIKIFHQKPFVLHNSEQNAKAFGQNFLYFQFQLNR